MNAFTRITHLLVLLFAFLFLETQNANAGGLTIVTHGFQTGDMVPDRGWVDAMANYVADRAGEGAAVYKMVVGEDDAGAVRVLEFTKVRGEASSSYWNKPAEAVIKVQWDSIAGFFETSTSTVADRVAEFLFNPPDSAGFEYPPLELPVHLIGHSRGGSLVSDLARRLGERGVWVDQMTTLDPRPVEGLGFNDAPVKVWETVTFADNYWESVAVPNGIAVPFAYNRYIPESALIHGGYTLGPQSSHSDIHLWYHGTLNTDVGASDGESEGTLLSVPIVITQFVRDTWYWDGTAAGENNEDEGKATGYYLSRLGGGWSNRGSATFKEGLISILAGAPVLRERLSNSASRTWPSIVNIRDTASGKAHRTTIQYQDFDSSAHVWIELDRDQNPYNINTVSLGANLFAPITNGNVGELSVNWNESDIPAGDYWLYALIRDDTHERHFHRPVKIHITTPAGPIATATAAPTNLAAAPASTSSINLAWSDNSSNETGFSIERKGANGSWSVVKTIGANASASASTSITGLSAATAYTFRVVAKNGTLASAASNEASATTNSTTVASYTLTVEAIDLDSETPLAAEVYTWLGASTDIQDRATPFTRTFVAGTEAKVACFPTAGGKAFKFMQVGDSVRNDTTWTIPMSGDKTLIIAYGSSTATGKTLTSVAIDGPSAMDENGTANYKARATFIDGTTAVVTASDWDITSGSASADISSSGRLDAEAVSSDKSVEIKATYTAGGVTKTATKSITIRNTVATQTYTLTLNAVNGHITPSPRGTSFAAGTVVSLTAYPDDDYVHTTWSGDASGTDRTVTVRMDRDRTVTANFALDTSTGAVQVNIQPPLAVTDGASWKVIGKISSTNWQPSGDTFPSLKPGNYNIIFKDIPGWITPDNIPVKIPGGPATLVNVTYREIQGAVQVTLTPPQALAGADGARWRLDGAGEWRESGATVADVSPGAHTIEFRAKAGWSTAPVQAITVARGLTTIRTGDYGPPAGLPIVTSVSPKTGPIEGSTIVTIEGANFQPSTTVTFGGVAASATFVSSAKITAVTPPRASYGTVPVVLTSGGQTVSLPNGFTYAIPLGQNMTLVSQIGGEVNAVALKGDYAFYGEGSSLAVANVSNPSSPVPKGRIALPGTVWSVAITGNYAVAAVSKWGIQVIDISDADAPRVVGFYDLPGESLDVVVIDNLAYVAASQAGLFVLDLSDKTAPVKVGEFTGATGAMDLKLTTVAGQRLACVACGSGGTRILDVTNPASITQCSAIPFGFARALAVSGAELFAYTTVSGQNAIRRYNLSDPANPQPSSAPIYDSGEEILFANGHLYLGRGGLYVRSLANPSQPIETGYVVLPGSTRRMAMEGALLYLANGNGGLVIANVTDEGHPSQVSAIGGDVSPHDVLVSNGYVYLAQGSLAVIDVSAPQHPVRIGKFTFSKSIEELAKAGDFLFSASGVFAGAPTLSVANPQNPTEVSVHSATPSRGSYDVATVGTNYLVAGKKKAADGGQAGLWLYNGAVPTNLSPLSTIEGSTTESFACVASAGTKVYVANGSGRFTIIDYATPSSPSTKGSLDIGDEVADIAVSPDGAFAYAATLNGGVRAIDCRNTMNPVIAGQYFGEGDTSARAVALSGNFVVCANFGSIVVVDFSDPAQPVKVAEYDVPGSCQGLATLGDLIFVADGTAGLEILRLGDVTLPLVEITVPVTGTTFPTTNAQVTLGGTATDLQGVARVTWENAQGGGGVAQTDDGWQHWSIADIQLAAGVNVITVTAEDAQGNLARDSITVTATLPESNGPVLLVTGPKTDAAFIFSDPALPLTGTAADASGVQSVAWANDRGGSGTTTGTSAWSADIPLADGPNRITLTARDTAGNESQTNVLVTYVPPDIAAPTVNITFPTDAQTAATTEPQVNLSGDADDDEREVVRVTWTNNRGGSGEAEGARVWDVNGIVLQPGVNILTISAQDAAGNVGSDTLALTFTPGARDAARPVLAVQTPRAQASVVEVDTITCNGQASGGATVREVVWQLNDGPWLTADSTANWTATVTPLAPGRNRIRFKAIDETGRESLTAERLVTYRKLAPLNLMLTGEGRVLINGKPLPPQLEVGRLYNAEAIPAAGRLFAGWEGDVVSQTHRIAFVMSDPATLRAVFIENPYVNLTATYRGLLRAEPLAHGASGAATVALAKTGAFTAKIVIGGKTTPLPLKGNFGGTGSYLGRFTLGGKRYDVLLALDTATPDAPVTGLVSDGTTTLALNAWPATRFTPDAPQAGAYTITIDPGTAPAPTSVSSGRMTVSKTGGIRFTGTIADGTKLTTGSAITAGARVPLYQAYDRARASLSVPLVFVDKPDSALDGIAFWTTRIFNFEPRLKAVRE